MLFLSFLFVWEIYEAGYSIEYKFIQKQTDWSPNVYTYKLCSIWILVTAATETVPDNGCFGIQYVLSTREPHIKSKQTV